ncbi:MAG: hypothetical protein RLZZ293_180 [Pseudomonadota bacterium]|jgi:thiol:disulfide interchange protein DsbC
MKKLLVGLLATLTLVACNDSSAKTNNLTPEQIKTVLATKMPNLPKIDQVNSTKINDLYEVVIGRQIFYVSKDGKYALLGNLVDLATQKSITEQRVQDLSKMDFSKLPLDLAIKQVIGNGSHKIAVFTDPDCPYCKKFEQDVVPNLKDVTVYSFLFPLPIHPNAELHAKQIWCSKDRTKTWTDWMVKNTPLPTDTSCNTSDLDKVKQIGASEVQVDGTPTIILENGQIIPGLVSPDVLNAKLSGSDKASASATK